MRSVGSKVGSFRKPNKSERARQKKFIAEEDKKFEDNPLYDPKAANSSAQRSNNLYKIKLKVDKTVVKSPEEQRKQPVIQDDDEEESLSPAKKKGFGDGPLSKENYLRFYNSMKAAHSHVGPRLATLLDDKRLYNEVIIEEPEEDVKHVAREDNPLITQEQIKILEAAVPKYTMKVLLGLSDIMFLTLKNTEYWMKTRGVNQRSKEKHFEFAKELFKIWDRDNGGYLDIDEISLPLISLGLSTDSGFVEKLIKSLKQKKRKEGEPA